MFVQKLDPAGAVAYSTLVGGNGDDEPMAIATAADGTAYVTGRTRSTDFPATSGGFHPPVLSGRENAFAVRVNATGTQLVYSTIFGGFHGADGWSITVDAAQDAYIAGSTRSPDYPVTSDAAVPEFTPQEDGVVTELDPAGALLYSSYSGLINKDAGIPAISVDTAGVMFLAQDPGTRYATTVGAYSANAHHQADAGVAATAMRCTISGTPGNDVLIGTPHRDVICGGGGNDRIEGRGGNDILVGGSGTNILIGGPGADVLIGGSGSDVMFGGPGADLLRGGAGGDRLAGGNGADTIVAGDGRDILRGLAGSDALYGGRGHDRCPDARGRNVRHSCAA